MTAPMFNDNKLKLGTFSANCSSGMAVTKVDERWINDWTNNIDLVQQCDEAGIEFMLPIARWIGYGGETDFHGNVLETVTWAAGLAAHSTRIQIFATVHTAFNHPVVVAKQLATLDQLSGGRIGLNVVAGWNKPEYDAFGVDLPGDHNDRYAMAQEWFEYVQKLWQENKAFDWDGRFYQGKGIYSLPHPVQSRLPIINAAASQEGREFRALTWPPSVVVTKWHTRRPATSHSASARSSDPGEFIPAQGPRRGRHRPRHLFYWWTLG